jgi:hypothetical protein
MNKNLYFLIILSLGTIGNCYCKEAVVDATEITEEATFAEEEAIPEKKVAPGELSKKIPWGSYERFINQMKTKFGDLEPTDEISIKDLLKQEEKSYTEMANEFMNNRGKIHTVLMYKHIQLLKEFLIEKSEDIENFVSAKAIGKALSRFKSISRKRRKGKFRKKTNFRRWYEKYIRILRKLGKAIDKTKKQKLIKRFQTTMRKATKEFNKRYFETEKAFVVALSKAKNEVNKLIRYGKEKSTRFKRAAKSLRKLFTKKKLEQYKKFYGELKKVLTEENMRKFREGLKKVIEEAKKWKEFAEEMKPEKEEEAPPKKPLPSEEVEEEVEEEAEEEKEAVKLEEAPEPEKPVEVVEEEKVEEEEIIEEEGVPVPPPLDLKPLIKKPAPTPAKPTKTVEEEESIFEQIRKFKKEKLKAVEEGEKKKEMTEAEKIKAKIKKLEKKIERKEQLTLIEQIQLKTLQRRLRMKGSEEISSEEERKLEREKTLGHEAVW